ncbi:MAG: T9SS type A sorting domain-containing protein [Reichenbachiella sp.]|uniref:fibronectin type III domain-containing protein n=1 Tax=Reichenbachiella sp. TaxID=2184521 RepID=UPI00329954E3
MKPTGIQGFPRWDNHAMAVHMTDKKIKQMKKGGVLVVMIWLILVQWAMGQQIDIISDWDSKTASWQNNNSLEKTANPIPASLINSTANCGKIISTTNQYDLILFNEASAFDFAMFSTFRFKVLPPASGGKVLLKFENADNSQSFSEEVTPTPSEWNAYEFDFSSKGSGVYTKMVIFFDLNGATAGNEWFIDEVEREGVGDTEAPSIPANLTSSEITDSSVRLTWDESEDNVAVKNYLIYQGAEQIKTTSLTYHYVSGLTASTTYSWSVKAEDIFGNISELSSSIEATTLSGSGILTEVSSRFNFRLGTQSIGPAYQFTSKDKLIESAEVTRAMGSNVLKVSFGDSYGLTDLTGTLKNKAEHRSFKQVFGMDFSYYHLWAYGPSFFYDGQTEAEEQEEYDAIYELTEHFLTNYSGTGKTFYLGNWEGDWHLVDDYNTPDTEWDVNKSILAPETVQGMIDWLNIRQKAVDDAKAATSHENVEVYLYVEANLVRKTIEKQLPSLVSKVLPFVNVDYVSYSCYDATSWDNTYEGVSTKLKEALDLIEEKLKDKDGLPEGKRVWIGEYGYPNGRNDFENIGYLDPTNETEQDAQSRHVMRAALEWGAPFVLYWELYNNEVIDGKQNGFWLINDKNEKQKIYYTHENYYANVEEDVETFIAENGREPNETELRSILVAALARSGNDSSDTIVLDVEENNVEVAIYPNPIAYTLSIKGFAGPLRVVDLAGNELKRVVWQRDTDTLDFSQFETGLYYLILEGNVNRTFKLIKK